MHPSLAYAIYIPVPHTTSVPTTESHSNVCDWSLHTAFLPYVMSAGMATAGIVAAVVVGTVAAAVVDIVAAAEAEIAVVEAEIAVAVAVDIAVASVAAAAAAVAAAAHHRRLQHHQPCP